MRTAMRLVGCAVALALTFGAAWQVGALLGGPGRAPVEPTPRAAPPAPDPPAPPAAPIPALAEPPLGLAATAAGYTLRPQGTTFSPGRTGELAFAVTGPNGRPVTAFDARGEPMRVAVVRRDAAGYQHLAPALGPDGQWRVPLLLPAAGVYRLYAEFAPTGGPPLVLGTDLFAPGGFSPVALPPTRVAQVGDYQVRLDGDLVPGGPSPMFATISRDGVPVTDLQPLRGAFGQLVALRRSDLAYLPIPADVAAGPAGIDRAGPGVGFTARVPTADGYRLFLEFRDGAGVHLAEFTIDTRDGA